MKMPWRYAAPVLIGAVAGLLMMTAWITFFLMLGDSFTESLICATRFC